MIAQEPFDFCLTEQTPDTILSRPRYLAQGEPVKGQFLFVAASNAAQELSVAS